MEAIWQDARYAARSLRRSPGFAVVAILTLALGIGATTAVFSVFDAVLLRPYPYPDVDRIVILSETTRSGQGLSIAWPNFQDWRERSDVFESLGVYREMAVNVTGGAQPERLTASLVSSDVFEALGIPIRLGRSFLPAEDRAGADRVAIVSDRLWHSRFNADPGVLGKPIVLNGTAHTIVGVAPPAMRFPSRATDVWLPVGLFVQTFPSDRGTHPGLFAVGKLKFGVSLRNAIADLDTIARALEKEYPLTNTDHTVLVTPYAEQIVANIRPALVTLIVAVAFVLLIGCANVANLMLARADRRRREFAVRAALGASRARTMQHLLVESILISLAGGAIGALLAAGAVRAFVASQPASVPRLDLVSVDVRVLAFALVISAATGLIFGLTPAAQASSSDLVAPLKDAARSSAGAGRRLRSALVVAEMALALVLLVSAGLTIRSLGRLMAIELGFDVERVVTMRVTLGTDSGESPMPKYATLPAWMRFHEELLRRISTLPGIEAAALSSAVPLEGGGSESEVVYEGQPPPSSAHDEATMCLFQTITPDYFRAMGIALIKGRAFTERDTADAPLVAVVDETLVRRLFPAVDPLGKRIAFEFRGTGPSDPRPIWREIVGVVRHVRHYGLVGEPPYVQVYAPLPQIPIWFQSRPPSMALVARTVIEPARLAASIRREVAAIDRDIPVYGVQPLRTYVAQNMEQPRISTALLAIFAALALMLAVVGIYGVLSYVVSLRTQEIGIRVALGASRADVLRLVAGHGAALTLAGIAVGLCASWIVASLLRAFLFGISPHDPETFGATAALLGVVALVASFVPAYRAARVDPAVTLRAE